MERGPHCRCKRGPEADPTFEISKPLEKLWGETVAAQKRRDESLLAEPHVPTSEYAEAGTRNARTVPAGLWPYKKKSMEPALYHAGPAGLKAVAGSGDPNASVADKIVRLLDKMISGKKKKRNRDEFAPHGANRPIGFVGTEGVRRQEEEEEDDRTGTEREHSVASDGRSSAFDVSPLLPLEKENLQRWHGWLYTKGVEQGNRAVEPHRESLKRFLGARGSKDYGDLSWQEKTVLRAIVERMVEAEAWGPQRRQSRWAGRGDRSRVGEELP